MNQKIAKKIDNVFRHFYYKMIDNITASNYLCFEIPLSRV